MKNLIIIVLFLSFLAGTTAVSAVELYRFSDAVTTDLSFAATEGALIEAVPRSLDVETLEIELLDGARYALHRTSLERRSADDMTWRGSFAGSDGRAVLTLKEGVLVGLLWAPDALYHIMPVASGLMLERIDQERFPPCSLDQIPQEQKVASHELPTPIVPTKGTIRIDLMTLYTPQARDAAGGTAQITAIIQNAVDQANTAFTDSDMVARFQLVHAGLASRSDSGNMSSDLSWVRNDPGVAALRDEHRADMVGLVVESGGCGLGYVMRNPGAGFASSAFQVVSRSCAATNLSFAHEHGHNMGFEHDPANSSTTPAGASYEWSFAHYVNGSYRTIMSYSGECTSGCPRVPHFSNPNVTHNGVATGLANERDNHRSGNLTAAIVAEFRDGALFADGFESGNTSNWSL